MSLYSRINKNVIEPKLRFNEFKDYWVWKTGDKVFESISNKDHNSNLPILAITQEHGAIPRELIDFNISVSEKSVAGYKVVEKGDFIISLRSFQGGIELSEYVGLCSPAYIVLRMREVLSKDFFKYYLKSKNYVNNLAQNLEGIRDGKMISYKYFSQVGMVFPSLPEQEKIAAFLTTVDDRLQTLQKKKSLLEQYKKGIMQRVFNYEEENDELRIRFKDEDGQEFPDWEVKKLGDLTYKVGKKNKHNIKYPIYSINNQDGFLPQSDQFEGLDSNDRGYDISMYKIVSENTFAYNPARINVGSIGYSAKLNEVIISSLYVCFKTKNDLEDQYLKAYVETEKFNTAVLRYQEGGVRQYLFYENFSQIRIPLPSKREQKRIADFLTAIDRKIELVEEQIAQTDRYKQGLLQKMFV